MCINWTKQLNWGWDPYFVRGVKTEMSYIAVNEVKSTTIKTGKGGASPCNPSIRATLFNRGLWSKLESKGSLACGRFCRLGSLSSGRYVLLVLVGFFFFPAERFWIICPTPGHDHLYFDSVLTIFTPAKDWSRYYCFSLPTMFDHGRRWCDRGVWQLMTMVCYELLTMVHCQSWLQNESMFFAKSMTANNKVVLFVWLTQR